MSDSKKEKESLKEKEVQGKKITWVEEGGKVSQESWDGLKGKGYQNYWDWYEGEVGL